MHDILTNLFSHDHTATTSDHHHHNGHDHAVTSFAGESSTASSGGTSTSGTSDDAKPPPIHRAPLCGQLRGGVMKDGEYCWTDCGSMQNGFNLINTKYNIVAWRISKLNSVRA